MHTLWTRCVRTRPANESPRVSRGHLLACHPPRAGGGGALCVPPPPSLPPPCSASWSVPTMLRPQTLLLHEALSQPPPTPPPHLVDGGLGGWQTAGTPLFGAHT